ncbi:DnaJ domain-containing protein [Clostridium thermobutyricum]|uniref:J domain-containing protein n=1 Tax=Clostridium thermobutyricum TaxID=29372 RepID=UPI002942EDA2|nr:DnaJ domain-containing protein [Clostridium thermobutyricum]
MGENLYEVLEVSKKASLSEIKKAYAKMLRKYPPEKYSKEFSKVNSAYEILSDKKQRYEYDQFNGYDSNAQVILDEGLRLIKEGELLEGKNRLISFLKLEGDVPSVLHELGKIYAEEENYTKAYNIQKKVFEKSKYLTYSQIEWMLFYLYKLNDEENLKSYLKKGILKFNDVNLYFNILDLYIEDRNYEQVREILFENVIPFLNKRGSVYGFCELSKYLFRIKEIEQGSKYLTQAINFEITPDNNEKLELIKGTIIEILDFENANAIIICLEELISYIRDIKSEISEEDYKDNLGWATITFSLVKEMAIVDRNNFHKTLKKFLLASVKKSIAIDEELKEQMDEDLIFYLEKLKEEYNVEKIKFNLEILEKFHKELYSIDAKYLFDKYGGFIPYEGEAKNKKSNISQNKKNIRKSKNNKKKLSFLIFICLVIVIIIGLLRFL